MQSKFKVFNNVIVVSTPLIVLDVPTSHNFPIFCLQNFFNFPLFFRVLLAVPAFEKSHFGVEERSMCFLWAITDCLPVLFAFPEDVFGGVEDLLDWVEAVRHEIPVDLGFVGLGIVVAFEIEDPVCVEVRMHWHVKRVGRELWAIAAAVCVLVLGIAGVAVEDRPQQDCQDEKAMACVIKLRHLEI